MRGAPVLLKYQGDVEAGTSKLPEKDRARVLAALAAHRAFATFSAVNLVCAGSAMLLEPVQSLLELAPVGAFWYARSGLAGNFLAAFLAFVGAQLGNLGFLALAKNLVIGTYDELDTEYYGDLHHKWVLMMTLGSCADACLDAIQGTCLAPMVLNALGATIGEDCCLFYGAVLEFDLLSIGDYGSTGEGCDITCHTVENMVVKFAPVSIGAGCSMRAESVCMPGATMEPCGVLVQGSQVLKGETVPGGEVWSGLPAAFVCAADDDRDAFYRKCFKQATAAGQGALVIPASQPGSSPPSPKKKNSGLELRKKQASLRATAAAPFDVDAVAKALGLSLAASADLFAARDRGDKHALRLFHTLGRLRDSAAAGFVKKTLPPPGRRPPHLRPGTLAVALEITVDDAKQVIRAWRDDDDVATEAVKRAKFALYAQHAGLDDPAGAEAVFAAARGGDDDATAKVAAYRQGGRALFLEGKGGAWGKGKGGRGGGFGKGKGGAKGRGGRGGPRKSGRGF